MGARFIKKRGVSTARCREELRTLAMVVCAVALPLILAFVLVGADMRSDLSDLIPAEALSGQGTALIGWGDLEILEGQLVSLEQERWQPQRRVRMLGYMMDGYTADARTHGDRKPAPDGTLIETFILLPEAGHVLHPAHRIPDQMVETWPTAPVKFQFRSLVWATGVLIRTTGRMDREKALYVMTAAEVQPAVQSDITLWFKP